MRKKAFAVIFLMACVGVAEGSFEIRDFYTDRPWYYQLDCAKLFLNVNITYEPSCVIKHLGLDVQCAGGFGFACDLNRSGDIEYGNYNRNCAGQSIPMVVDESNYDHCFGYGGDNFYTIEMTWCIPVGVPAGICTATVDVNPTDVTTFEIRDRPSPPPTQPTPPPETTTTVTTTTTTTTSTTTTTTLPGTTTTLESTTTTTTSTTTTTTLAPKPPDDEATPTTVKGKGRTPVTTTLAPRTGITMPVEITTTIPYPEERGRLDIDTPRLIMKGEETRVYVNHQGKPIQAQLTIIEADGSKRTMGTDENGMAEIILFTTGRTHFIATKVDYHPASGDSLVIDISELLFHPYSIMGLILLVGGGLGLVWLRTRRFKTVVSYSFITSGDMVRLLEGYKELYVTPSVFKKIGEEYPGKIKLVEFTDKDYNKAKAIMKDFNLDAENAEAVVLANKIRAKKIIVPEKDVELVGKAVGPQITVEYPW
jgi:hypothetical protein